MLQNEHEEGDIFIDFIERAVSQLANGDYTGFLSRFDESRLTAADVILALKFLDEDCVMVQIDDPLEEKDKKNAIDIGKFNDDSGYYLDYELSTDGEPNDLTLSCEFLKTTDGYRVVLSDLHTM